MFEHITVSWIKKYEAYLKIKINTINSNLRSIRRIINAAIEEDIISSDLNPFRKFKLSLERVKKEYLTKEELYLIENARLETGSMKDVHRNMFIFSSYAGGLRISDVITLRWRNYESCRIIMQTKKTSTVVSFLLPEKAKKITEQYRQKNSKADDLFFRFLIIKKIFLIQDDYLMQFSSATVYTNDDLKEIASGIELTKRISFHTARHTFAIRALSQGMRIEYVCLVYLGIRIYQQLTFMRKL
jgi:integrase/recombinase XerD